MGFVRTMNLITTAMFRGNFATSWSRDRSLQRESPFQRDKILLAKVLRAGRTSLARKLPPRHLRTEIDSRQDKPR